MDKHEAVGNNSFLEIRFAERLERKLAKVEGAGPDVLTTI
jgi:hypothetical protein